MYRKILVPLDGSKLAECILPHVESIAKGCDTKEVILISVTEHIVGYKPEAGPTQPVGVGLGFSVPVTKVPVDVGKMQKQADRYLNRKAKQLAKKGIAVKTQVLLGNPAEEITSFAKQEGVDLIVMASHGRSGISRWAFGSVADKVFRASSSPVLMVKASASCPST